MPVLVLPLCACVIGEGASLPGGVRYQLSSVVTGCKSAAKKKKKKGRGCSSVVLRGQL